MINKLFSKKTKGQALVELAIALPVLILIVFGIIEIGRYMYFLHNIKYAANEATVMAGTKSSPGIIRNCIKLSAGAAIKVEDNLITIDYTDESGDPLVPEEDYKISDDRISFTDNTKTYYCKIKVAYNYQPIVPYPTIGKDTNPSFQVSASMHVRVQ